jgi:hypothetical protein
MPRQNDGELLIIIEGTKAKVSTLQVISWPDVRTIDHLPSVISKDFHLMVPT